MCVFAQLLCTQNVCGMENYRDFLIFMHIDFQNKTNNAGLFLKNAGMEEGGREEEMVGGGKTYIYTMIYRRRDK